MSELNHYLVDATVKDVQMNVAGEVAFDVKVAVLGTTEEDAADLVTHFFSIGGIGSKEIEGVHTLYRTEAELGPNSMRSVHVNNVAPFPQLIVVPAQADIEDLQPEQAEDEKLMALAKKKAEKAAAKAAEKAAKEALKAEPVATEPTGDLQTAIHGEANTEVHGEAQGQSE